MEEMIDCSLSTCIRSALADEGVSGEEMDQVFVFGGSAQIPCLQETVRKLFNDRVVVPIHCQEVIAEGAAIHASYKQEFQSRSVCEVGT